MWVGITEMAGWVSPKFANVKPLLEYLLELWKETGLHESYDKVTHISFYGLCGIASYVIARLQNRKNVNPFLTNDYCSDLTVALDKNSGNDETALELKEILIRVINGEHFDAFFNPVSGIIDRTKYNAASLFEKTHSLGIANNGYAGIGLRKLKTK
jgi:hypothetical protein